VTSTIASNGPEITQWLRRRRSRARHVLRWEYQEAEHDHLLFAVVAKLSTSIRREVGRIARFKRDGLTRGHGLSVLDVMSYVL
jgi:hypothetical protein